MRGVGPGVLVAVCVRRSVDLVNALLAVTRSGAAFLAVLHRATSGLPECVDTDSVREKMGEHDGA
jgi:non-ribosomal peptide synthetase component F